jgi:hypothetical protein
MPSLGCDYNDLTAIRMEAQQLEKEALALAAVKKADAVAELAQKKAAHEKNCAAKLAEAEVQEKKQWNALLVKAYERVASYCEIIDGFGESVLRLKVGNDQLEKKIQQLELKCNNFRVLLIRFGMYEYADAYRLLGVSREKISPPSYSHPSVKKRSQSAAMSHRFLPASAKSSVKQSSNVCESIRVATLKTYPTEDIEFRPK